MGITTPSTQHPLIEASASTPNPGWSHLPKETQALIISYLDQNALTALAQTSKSDNKLVYDWAIQEVGASTGFRTFPNLESYLSTLERYFNLKCLNLSNVRIDGQKINDDQFNAIIHYCQHKGLKIEALDLSGLSLTLRDALAIPTLIKLSLRDNKEVTDAGLNNLLKGNVAIKELDLRFTSLSLEGIKPVPTLTKISLYFNLSVTDIGLDRLLEGNDVIQELDLSGTNIRLEKVRPLLTLTNLTLSVNWQVRGAGLSNILESNTVIQHLDCLLTHISPALVKQILSRRNNKR